MNEKTVSASLFYTHGILCVSHPVEVLLVCVTSTVCLITLNIYDATHIEATDGSDQKGLVNKTPLPSGMHIGPTSYFLAMFYVIMQCKKLIHLGSKYIFGVVAVFVIFSCTLFGSIVLHLCGKDIAALREALPFFFLLVDFNAAANLVKCSVEATSNEKAHKSIAYSVATVGPNISLNTLVGALVIGVGTLSGVAELETISFFGCLSLLTNYVMFMTFLPACLSLLLEICDRKHIETNRHTDTVDGLLTQQENAPNPVVQQIKLVMSTGLMLVHVYSRSVVKPADDWRAEYTNDTSDGAWLTKFLAVNAEQVVTIIVVLLVAVRYLLMERDSKLFDVMEKKKQLTDKEELPVKRSQSSTEPRKRSLDEIKADMKDKQGKLSCLPDEELIMLVESKSLPSHQLEKVLDDPIRAVHLRRQVVEKKLNNYSALSTLPYENYDYSPVMGACCENVIGYMPVPVGVAGPLLLDGQSYHVPMATTEGCLVASTNRGCRALMLSGGVQSSVIGDGMTRGPVLRLPSAVASSELKLWLDDEENFELVKEVFDSTSRFARLQSLHCAVAGRLLFVRFKAITGDAMGMNMVSKGTEKALQYIQEEFPAVEIISLSGNYCTDKKATSINWIEGRGKSVVCEAIVPANVVSKILKTNSLSLINLNINKNLVGSAMAGAIGGFNAHAANIVTALFIATGQDAAQIVSSCNCITLVEACGPTEEDLYISCTMPSLEVGTVGGGTVLPSQAAALQMLGVHGPNKSNPGKNSTQLARIICATVLAGELSLLAALAAGHLVSSHLKHNRSTANLLDIVDGARDPSKKCAVL